MCMRACACACVLVCVCHSVRVCVSILCFGLSSSSFSPPHVLVQTQMAGDFKKMFASYDWSLKDD